jgi:hypothetical protein
MKNWWMFLLFGAWILHAADVTGRWQGTIDFRTPDKARGFS